MLNVIGAESIDQLINETIPEGIRLNKRLNLPRPVSEIEFLNEFQELASRNKIFLILLLVWVIMILILPKSF